MATLLFLHQPPLFRFIPPFVVVKGPTPPPPFPTMQRNQFIQSFILNYEHFAFPKVRHIYWFSSKTASSNLNPVIENSSLKKPLHNNYASFFVPLKLFISFNVISIQLLILTFNRDKH